MMSCGVSLERLSIDQPVMLTASELNDKTGDVSEANASQQTSEENVALDLQSSKCSGVEKGVRKSQKKYGQHMHRPACSNSSDGGSYDSMSSTAELRLTLKKVKMENSDKEDEKCFYECHTKKPSMSSKKSLVKSEDRSRSAVNQTTSAATKDIDGSTDSGKVITTMLILLTVSLSVPVPPLSSLDVCT